MSEDDNPAKTKFFCIGNFFVSPYMHIITHTSANTVKLPNANTLVPWVYICLLAKACESEGKLANDSGEPLSKEAICELLGIDESNLVTALRHLIQLGCIKKQSGFLFFPQAGEMTVRGNVELIGTEELKRLRSDSAKLNGSRDRIAERVRSHRERQRQEPDEDPSSDADDPELVQEEPKVHPTEEKSPVTVGEKMTAQQLETFPEAGGEYGRSAPKLEEVLQGVKSLNIPDEYARSWYAEMSAKDWIYMNGNQEVLVRRRNWKACISTFYRREKKNASNPYGPDGTPRHITREEFDRFVEESRQNEIAISDRRADAVWKKMLENGFSTIRGEPITVRNVGPFFQIYSKQVLDGPYGEEIAREDRRAEGRIVMRKHFPAELARFASEKEKGVIKTDEAYAELQRCLVRDMKNHDFPLAEIEAFIEKSGVEMVIDVKEVYEAAPKRIEDRW